MEYFIWSNHMILHIISPAPIFGQNWKNYNWIAFIQYFKDLKPEQYALTDWQHGIAEIFIAGLRFHVLQELGI